MRPRQSKSQQFLKVIESLEPDVAKRPRHRRVRRAAYAAGGLALVTAASAGISSLRDRLDT
jgi:hypothetical protein